jgi:hypothetical protein
MAITHSGNIGQTRIRMAKMLEKSIPGLCVEPRDLWSQIPVYATAQWDCCSWGGGGILDGRQVNIASWDTMTECLKYGIGCTVDPLGKNTYSDIEVSSMKGAPNA